jgi:hypothetical protein
MRPKIAIAALSVVMGAWNSFVQISHPIATDHPEIDQSITAIDALIQDLAERLTRLF